jgi:putative ABC transport system permease protein
MRTLKIIFRGFKKNSLLNLLNVSSMAIGIASAIILMGYIYQEFHYDTQQVTSDRIYRVLMQNERNELSGIATHGPLAQGLKSDFPEIEDATRVSFYWGYLALTAGDKMFNENKSIFADPNFFTLFSFPLAKGNAATCLSSPHSIVLSETASMKYFGEGDALGKQIKIGKDKLFTVTGIYKDFPKNSNFQEGIILPLENISQLTQVHIEPSWKYPTDITTFVLLKVASESENLSEKIKDYLSAHVQNKPEKLQLQSLESIHTDHQIYWESTPQVNQNYLYFLAIVAIVILAMSGANFLLLYIGTASKRKLTTGVKTFCGASKSIIFREHLREIIAYIAISFIASFVLLYSYNSIFTSQFTFLPKIVDYDFKLVVFLMILMLVFAILIAGFPAIIISTQKPDRIFKTGGHTIIGRSKAVNLLVTGQFTMGVVLIAVTILFYKQLDYLDKHDPGFAKEELITIPLNMHIGDGIYNENVDLFANELKNQVGVKNVTLSFSLPSNIQTSADEFKWEGKPEGMSVPIQWNSVFFDYFETLGLKIVEGRSFNRNYPGDMLTYDDGARCAYILNQKALAEMELSDPIGKAFEAYDRKGTIVGIVENYNFKSLHSEITPMCFFMNPFYYSEIIVRINPKTVNVLDNIETVWKKFVPEYPLEFNYVTDQLDKMYESENNLAASLNTFSAIAIIIACMGLLALTMLSMQQRTKEIGIRKVNGARISEVLIMLNRDFVKWVTIAFVIATPIAYYAMHKWLQNFAYKTELSWWIFALAGLLALGIALLTVSWQSWRAATKNPVEALRYE